MILSLMEFSLKNVQIRLSTVLPWPGLESARHHKKLCVNTAQKLATCAVRYRVSLLTLHYITSKNREYGIRFTQSEANS